MATYEDPVDRLYLDGELKLEGEGKGGAIRYEGDVRTELATLVTLRDKLTTTWGRIKKVKGGRETLLPGLPAS